MIFLETAAGKIHGLVEAAPEDLDELAFLVRELRRHMIFRSRLPAWRFPSPLDTEDC